MVKDTIIERYSLYLKVGMLISLFLLYAVEGFVIYDVTFFFVVFARTAAILSQKLFSQSLRHIHGFGCQLWRTKIQPLAYGA